MLHDLSLKSSVYQPVASPTMIYAGVNSQRFLRFPLCIFDNI